MNGTAIGSSQRWAIRSLIDPDGIGISSIETDESDMRELGRTVLKANGLTLKKGLPVAWIDAKMQRRIQKSGGKLALTLVCGLVTILVLRGTMGVDSFFRFSSPEDELFEGGYEPEQKRSLPEVRNFVQDGVPPSSFKFSSLVGMYISVVI